MSPRKHLLISNRDFQHSAASRPGGLGHYVLEFGATAVAVLLAWASLVLPCAAQEQAKVETPEQVIEQQQAEKRIAEAEKLKRRRALPETYASSEAYANPKVTVGPDDFGDFGAAMRSLSAQAKIAIVAEGAPVYLDLTKERESALEKSFSGSDGTLDSALKIIGDAFDYRPIRLDSRTVLLSKEFHDPNDLPFVTYDEALYDLKGTKRIVSAIDPDLPVPIAPNSPLINFVIDATKQFGTGALRAGLPIAQFSASLGDVAQQYAVSSYLDVGVGPANNILVGLDGMQNKSSIFLSTDLDKTGLTVTGFEGPFRYDGKNNEFIISHGFHFQHGGVNVRNGSPRLVLGGYSIPLPPNAQARLAQIVGKGLGDPGAPTDADYVPQPVMAETTTLADLARKLDTLATKPDLTISVNPALGAKPVTLFGASALKPEEVWRDVAILYGLRVQHLDHGVAYLTMAPTTPVKTLEDAVPAIERMYPQPWLRALLGGTETAETATFAAALPDAERKNLPVLEVRYAAHLKAPENAKDAIFDAAVHRLRVLIEPELKKSPDGRLPMSRMNDEEKRLFALVFACDYLQGMDHFTSKEPPRSLTDRSQLVISAMLDAPTGSSNFWFGYIDSYSHFVYEGGAQMPTPKEYVGTNTKHPN